MHRNNNGPKHACDSLNEMLNTPPKRDGHFGLFNAHNTYTKDSNELERRKIACKRGMVESPYRKDLFVTPEAYRLELIKAEEDKEDHRKLHWFPLG